MNTENTETSTNSKDITKMSYEDALKELETIVNKLENGDVPLEESISIYERGDKLRAHCNKLLSSAESKVEKIRISSNGSPEGTEPLDVEED